MSKKEHTITINGRETTVKRNTLLVDACRELGIHVPTLCHNESLEPYGVCRICLVELKDGKRTKVVPSCVYEIRKDGLEVTTESERITRNRKWVIQWLLNRCENEEVIQNLAAEYGVEVNPRLKRHEDDCILCGMCVRACHEIVGVGAIAYEGRGHKRVVVPPYRAENDVCVACGTCAYICPTKCIGFNEENGVRTITRYNGNMVVRKTDMVVGKTYGNWTVPEALVNVMGQRLGVNPEDFDKNG